MTTFAKNFSILVQTPSSSAPAPAAAVGYHTQTFGDAISIGSNWFKTDLGGGTSTIAHNSDGSITIFPDSDAGDGHQIDTAVFNGSTFSATAFGPGYFECVFSFTGEAPPEVPCPAFWANDWQNQVSPPLTQWPGQAQGYVRSIEVDCVEVNNGLGSMGFTIHDWHGHQSSIIDFPAVSDGSPSNGLGDQTQRHTYSFLWVPATNSTQGYVKFYFGGAQQGNTILWDLYNPSDPPSALAEGSTAFSILDQRQLYLICGTGPGNPMTIERVSVWQNAAGAAQNVVNP